jgi:hypothetical protein
MHHLMKFDPAAPAPTITLGLFGGLRIRHHFIRLAAGLGAVPRLRAGAIGAALVVALSAALVSAVGAADPPAAREREIKDVPVRAVADDQSSLTVRDGDTPVGVTAGKEWKKRLEDLRPGDRVTVRVTDEPPADSRKDGTAPKDAAPGATAPRVVLKDISAAQTIPMTRWGRVGVLLGALAMLCVVALVTLRTHVPKLLVGKDGRYSNSKFQMAIWFAVLIVTYIAAVWIRVRWGDGLAFIGGVNLPQNLLLLSGISALTFGAAKGITMQNIEAGQDKARKVALATGQNPIAAAAAAKTDVKPDAQPGERSLMANLVNDDNNEPDIGDFQMLVVTLLAVVVYLGQVFAFLGSMERLQVVTLPDVDTTILAAFGLGQGAYLTKKYAGKNGA